jgi:hypothetical protein
MANGPSGVIAIGHSGLTGEGAGGPAFSWATGQDPSVNSLWLRIRDVDEEVAGLGVNAAEGGAPSDALAAQAEEALRTAPAPALAVVATIDADIRCDGTDDVHVPELGANLRAALDVITAASPDTKILVVAQAGRPSVPYIKELVARDTSAIAALKEGGMCAFFDAEGRLLPDNFETLTAIIEKYEAEQARVCAEVPQCRTDGGVRAAYADRLENFSADWAHLNPKGQAAQAELLWPVVADMLGL